MMAKFGCGFTPRTLDDELSIDIQVMNYCIDQEQKAGERQQKIAQGYQDMGIVPLQ